MITSVKFKMLLSFVDFYSFAIFVHHVVCSTRDLFQSSDKRTILRSAFSKKYKSSGGWGRAYLKDVSSLCILITD